MVQDSDDTGTWTICEYGGGDLWRRVQECYTRWEQFGKPATTSYAFTFIDGEQWVALSQLAGQWRIASA
jgi:hypothetical protein